ncbi:MAG: Rnf-Nqr domain containing protein [Steroidobacteraceae bacterium]
MATLLIILLGTVLIQSSTVAAGGLIGQGSPRGVFADELRTASFTVITLTLASALGFGTHQALPPQMNYLQMPLLLAGMALIFLGARSALQKVPGAIRWPDLLTHLTTQCAMLGMALFSATVLETFAAALGYGVGAALMLVLLSASFTALRERIDAAAVPMVFRGIPIALITAGFMALALLGFSGMVRN